MILANPAGFCFKWHSIQINVENMIYVKKLIKKLIKNWILGMWSNADPKAKKKIINLTLEMQKSYKEYREQIVLLLVK